MYTKQVLFIVSLIILVAMFNTAWACHESDTGLRGHNPDLRFAGISVVTEAAFALTSTTTGCDHYTYFIQQSYHQIAENAARGEGEYLEAAGILRNQILGLIETTPSLSESCSIKLIPESQKAPS